MIFKKTLSKILLLCFLVNICLMIPTVKAITDEQIKEIASQADTLSGLPVGYKCSRTWKLADLSGRSEPDFEAKMREEMENGRYRLEIGGEVKVITRNDMLKCAEALRRVGRYCRISEVEVFNYKTGIETGTFTPETLNPGECVIPTIRREDLCPIVTRSDIFNHDLLTRDYEPTSVFFWGDVSKIAKRAFSDLKNTKIEFNASASTYGKEEMAIIKSDRFHNLENTLIIFKKNDDSWVWEDAFTFREDSLPCLGVVMARRRLPFLTDSVFVLGTIYRSYGRVIRTR